MKLFEYMAAERPIVASRLPSITEVLNEENSVLIEPDDPVSLGDGIRGILDDEERARRIARQAREDVERHTWRNRARAILDFIHT